MQQETFRCISICIGQHNNTVRCSYFVFVFVFVVVQQEANEEYYQEKKEKKLKDKEKRRQEASDKGRVNPPTHPSSLP